MKGRFDNLDVTVMVKELRKDIMGLRVANIYDINNKTYLFKLAQPDKKRFLMVESGVRLHLTEFVMDKNKIPGVFAAKVRDKLENTS
jgi:predicted ribosome quality control (RQC) complex YloA/Tae2 family protein